MILKHKFTEPEVAVCCNWNVYLMMKIMLEKRA